MMHRLLLAVALLPACTQYEWYNPNATQQSVKIDVYECQRDTYLATPGIRTPQPLQAQNYTIYDNTITQTPTIGTAAHTFANTLRDRERIDAFFGSCMTSRGYYLRETK